MKKKLNCLLLLLGLALVVSPMMLSCSDNDETTATPDGPAGKPHPTVPTPIKWVENEVDGGTWGVGIKVLKTTSNNFVFECTPGDKVQSYRLDVYPLCRMYNYLLENCDEDPTDEEIEELIQEALFNSQGAGAYTFSKGLLGDNYSKAEFDWANSQYAQSEIVPGAEYLIITIGCNDEDGRSPADMKICYLKTPEEDVIGSPRVDIEVKTSYRAASVKCIPNEDCKYFYQFCLNTEPIDEYIDAYGEDMYIDFMRHTTVEAEKAPEVPEENLPYVIDFGYTADAKQSITATTIGLDENKNKGEYVRKDFHLKEIPEVTDEAECKLEVTKIGASIVSMNLKMEKSCYAAFYRVFDEGVWTANYKEAYENADKETMTSLARQLDEEGWGIKNINFNQGGSYTASDYQYELFPNSNYYIAYIGRNQYGQLSDVKVVPFKTISRVTDNPAACKAELDITISDFQRTSLKLNYSYNQETAVYYHQYIMTPDLLEEENKEKLVEYLMSEDSNVWYGDANDRNSSFTWTGLDPATEYTFAYMAEDWNGVLSEVKIVKGTTEAIIAGPNPEMKLEGYMSEIGNFTVKFSIVKDVAKQFYAIIEDEYSADGDYTYEECMDVWKEYCLENGLSGVNSSISSYGHTKDAKRLVALCVPYGEDAEGNPVIGDLYTLFYDKDKGIITDPSVLFPDAPKLKSGMQGAVKPQVVKKENRVPAKLIVNKPVNVNTPGIVKSGNVIYLDMKKLGRHPHSK